MKKILIILPITLIAFGLGYWTGTIKKSVDEKYDIVTEAVETSEQSSKENILKQAPQQTPTIDNNSYRPKAGLILAGDNFQIRGDTTIDKEKIYMTSIKFEPYISFEDFPAETINTADKANLDLSSKEGARSFKTRITNAYKADTANFAGHYTFAWWGCGSPCQDGVIVDRRTGKIYEIPSGSLGYNFRPDSRMLIVNLPDSAGFYEDCLYCKPTIYVLNEDTKEFVERMPGLPQDK